MDTHDELFAGMIQIIRAYPIDISETAYHLALQVLFIIIGLLIAVYLKPLVVKPLNLRKS